MAHAGSSGGDGPLRVAVLGAVKLVARSTELVAAAVQEAVKLFARKTDPVAAAALAAKKLARFADPVPADDTVLGAEKQFFRMIADPVEAAGPVAAAEVRRARYADGMG